MIRKWTYFQDCCTEAFSSCPNFSHLPRSRVVLAYCVFTQVLPYLKDEVMMLPEDGMSLRNK